MAEIIVEAAPRTDRGKNEARRLRRTGQVPAVLYGGKGETLAVTVNAKQVTSILRSETGHNTLFQVKLGAKRQSAILKDWQVDPLSGALLHVDLLRVAMDVRMRVKVRSEEHTSELQSPCNLVCRLLLEKKKKT